MTRARLLAALLAALALSPHPASAGHGDPVDMTLEEPIQYALEHVVSGTRTTTSVRGTAIVVEPLRTWKSVSGFYCRRYQVTVSVPGQPADRSEHTRCRTGDGIWHPTRD